MDGRAFRKRVIIAMLVAYALPPVIGIGFLVGVLEMITAAEIKAVMSGSLLPVYVIGTTVAAAWYFTWLLKPVTRFADGKVSLDDAIACMHRFSGRYWVLYVARHLLGALVLSLSARSVLGHELTFETSIRMAGLGVMLSCLAGLPVYAYIMDFFAGTFREHTLREPVFRIRVRILLVAVLVPVALNTAILLYLLSRLEGVTAELLVLWFALLGFAIVAAYNLIRSLDRSVKELRQISTRRARDGDLRPQDLRVQSLDELGVLTCEYRDLLSDLEQQARLLDLRNQVLTASSHNSEPNLVYEGLLNTVSGLFLGGRARLIAASHTRGSFDVLGSKDEEPLLHAQDTPPELAIALKESGPTFLSGDVFEGLFTGASGSVAVVPVRTKDESDEEIAILVSLDSPDDQEACELAMFEKLRGEIEAALRGTQLSREKTRLQQVMMESQRMELVGRLAAGVAHDFNNILTVIVSAAGLLEFESKEESVSSELVSEYSQLIMESSQRASELTRQLLTFSQQQVGQVTIFELNELVEALRSFLRRLLPEDIGYEVSLGPNVGRIKADKGHIEQVITNLVVNSRDAMENGGTLKIETAQEDGSVVLRVIDDGCGMDPEVLSHLFEPFFTTKSPNKGTGLGLATTYGIIKNYGGEIDVKSVPGQGTEMTVRLPSEEEVSTAPVKVKSSPLSLSSGKSILLVEDEGSVRRLIEGILTRQGYHVVAVANGQDAMTFINDEDRQFSLLLSDIVMPGMKGTEVAMHMAEHRPDAKILLMTGYADANSLKTARAENFSILSKPFPPKTLLEKIDSILSASTEVCVATPKDAASQHAPSTR